MLKRPGLPGQRQGKGRALAHDTLHGHLPPMRGHDLLHNVQAEPCSPRLGGMQRLEDLCQAFFWYPTSRIAHLELDLVGCALASQGHSAPRGHGIERVVY